jgi:hypothetical protein
LSQSVKSSPTTLGELKALELRYMGKRWVSWQPWAGNFFFLLPHDVVFGGVETLL